MKTISFILLLIFSLTMNAQQKALVIIDIQNDYFAGGNMPLVRSDEAVLNAKLVLEQFRNEGLPVIHIQHVSDRPGATFFVPGTPGVEIHSEVAPLNKEKVIVKHFPNSFRETELQDYLKELGISDLVICGMMTSMCVDATTRAAKDFGYNCTVIGDACAAPNLEINGKTVSGENVHNAFLAALNYFYATVVNVKDFNGANN
ncbi:cysteine hydrolase family protein [Dysgonomonas sp. GY617]|uniref:cysteine hydrolase family protein n=1 Tax=Dysgonomonas sp. GY617 TaxID=2780420 RepID=UPI0018EF9242|nr:cysteine hydrolase family protein [Dysgonomonas sp. GY617]